MPFNLYYPHVEVWVCTLERFNPDIIITLTLDSLQGKYYVKTIPQDLSYTKWNILFADDMEGKYVIYEYEYEDSVYTYMYMNFFESSYGTTYSLTMLSPDTMKLGWYEGPGELTVIRVYLFVKQSNF